jgi:hypothetical protein
MAEETHFRIEASADTACGVYANASIVSTTGAESRIDFLYVDRVNKNGDELPAHLVSRVIMPTTELSNLSETLTKHISKHLEKGMQ